jgi:hypothetical protein
MTASSAKNFNLTEEQVSRAAAALGSAVSVYLASTKSGKGRKTASGFADVVRRSLGRQRVSKSLFTLVLHRAVEMKVVEVAKSESGRTYLRKPERPKNGVELDQEQAPVQARTWTPAQAPATEKQKSAVEPKNPYPEDHCCTHCGWQASLCVHCGDPPWDDDLYVDSRGRWRCSSCNDLAFAESWGGYLRWKNKGDPMDSSDPDNALVLAEGEE